MTKCFDSLKQILADEGVVVRKPVEEVENENTKERIGLIAGRPTGGQIDVPTMLNLLDAFSQQIEGPPAARGFIIKAFFAAFHPTETDAFTDPFFVAFPPQTLIKTSFAIIRQEVSGLMENEKSHINSAKKNDGGTYAPPF